MECEVLEGLADHLLDDHLSPRSGSYLVVRGCQAHTRKILPRPLPHCLILHAYWSTGTRGEIFGFSKSGNLTTGPSEDGLTALSIASFHAPHAHREESRVQAICCLHDTGTSPMIEI